MNSERLDLVQFDWERLELFEEVLHLFFKDLELGARSMEGNDFIDLFLMLYVIPGRKYWTKEKKWINYIKQAGLEDKYLFQDN